ncbi:tRNA (guanine(9)-N1)-methyltransferase [Penicillium macrosclerotiorum]|uniref:tRNA (guanine(9)-N1)-methyltransferase n=1 Tax=Penicillium macrosclerotiorum TaxID=303699 RepID=UPI0025480BA1|nr:tRNA (guanine(9)-N1)-methyltransferase [Penicillium macrosclerotiorum]KAJ5692512.1 tRNA (guanine(9)-N1)-methyltransferase [Penicillium macrosclerotiorum]
MDEEERPRKLAKLDHDEETTNHELGPAMTGAVTVDDELHLANAPVNDGSKAGPSEILDAHESELAISCAPADYTQDAEPKISKNQLRKLRRKEQWEAGREERKVKRREQAAKKKERRHQMIKEARETGGQEAVLALRKQWETTRSKSRKSTLLPIGIIIDCSYDELMKDGERISLAGQLTRSYSDNNRATWRSHLMFSSFNKLLKERFDTVLWAHKNWKGIRLIPEDFVHGADLLKADMASPRGGQLVGPFADKTDAKPEDGEVIYLSSDSDNTLTELNPYGTYIIGGLVDKNRHKAICYKTAVEKGIKTAKLPIGDYVQMASRSVLTTNHVVDIMLKWLEVRDWGEAFMTVIPQRKGGKLKDSADGAEDHEVDGEEEETNLEKLAKQMEVEQEEVGDDDAEREA